MRRAALVAVLALACGAVPAAARPDGAPLRAAAHTRAQTLAIEYADASRELLAAIDAWQAADSARGARPPAAVEELAFRQQLVVRRLVRDRRLFARVLARVPAAHRRALGEEVRALRELASIHSVVVQRPRVRIGPAQPPGVLREHYRRAWRRFGVGWPLLAAVNHVESAFGRLRNESTSGARGPMQFMPATWAAYGLGGDVRDPRDAILGAANYLHANGAPGDEARALYHYNPSRLYVSAVRRFARIMRADDRAFIALYARAVHYRGAWRTGPRA